MSLMKRCLAGLGMMLAVTGLTGCPQAVLHVEPLSKSFGETAVTDAFRIYNTGYGTLNWQVTEDIPWLRLSVDGGVTLADALTGETGTEVDVIGMYVDRGALPYATSTGEIRITSSAGTEVVRVSAVKSPAAQLQVPQTAVDFGMLDQQRTLTITNGGVTKLEWSAAVAADAPWLTVAPLSGALASSGNSAALALSVNRTGLAGGAYTGILTITSNGGNASITVTMSVPPFSVTPGELPFGTLLAPVQQQIALRNNTFDPLPVNVTAVTGGGQSWLSVSETTALIPVGTPQGIGVTANPSGLTPGEYAGEIRVAAVDGSYEVALGVSMVVPGLGVMPSGINFGTISATDTETVTLENLGTQPIAWQAAVPVSEARWLSVSPSSGTLQDLAALTVTAAPGNVAPGTYSATISITSDGGDRTVTVQMVRPRPAALQVEPSSVDFGATRTEQLLALWNDGIGEVQWRVDTAGFPAWLSLTPVDGEGVASGSVSGEATSTLTMRVDRALAPAGAIELTHAFWVTASGDASEGVYIQAKMSVPLIPELTLTGEGIDDTGITFVNFDVREDTQTFIIRNEGNGPLDWTIAAGGLPKWITSVSPMQGTLAQNTQQIVTVAVDRSGLDYRGAQYEMPIVSNDPKHPEQIMLVEVQVPKGVSIGVTPAQVGFGENQTSTILAVANLGDPETVLNFKITKTKEWLAVFPNTGTSIGTALPEKDWRSISLSVDRAQLEGLGASAKLTVFATRLENGITIQDDTVEPIEITVTVDATPLTIETARPAQRVPSMSRYVLLMRDVQYRPILYPEAQLGELAGKVKIYEDDVLMDNAETNQFITPGRRARGTVLILLDYSGSMQEAAGLVPDGGVAAAPNPLQALYEQTVPYLINELPDNYRAALGVFSERGASGIRMISGGGDTLFTKDKALLEWRLRNADVRDNGATMLFEAFAGGMNALLAEDGDHIPFDTSDDRVLVMVTDGRITTPPGEITPYILMLEDSRVRPFVVGWGVNPAADPLIRLSTSPGGHYYATRTQDTGQTNSAGDPVRLPLMSELKGWFETTSDPCDRSVGKDLASQIVLSYVSLNEMAGVTVEGRMAFDNPNDQNSPCISDQGDIAGSFKHTQVDFMTYAGDPRLGQVSLQTEGIQNDDTCEILVRGDYMPRNIDRLAFRIFTESGAPGMTMEVVRVAQTEGGMIHDWTVSQSGNVYSYTTPDAPLFYGEFGDLLRLRFTGAATPFDLRFEVEHPQITTHPDSKYFMHPDIFHVGEQRLLAPSSPYPMIETEPALNLAGILDLGTDEDAADIFLTNMGGSHEPTFVGLYWEASVTEGADFLRLVNVPKEVADRMLYSGRTPFDLMMTVDRSGAPGIHYGEVELLFDSIFHNTITRVLTVYAEISNPLLAVSPALLTFPAGTTQRNLSVSNAGQSTMAWEVEVDSLPEWFALSDYSGLLGPEETLTLRASIVAAQVDPLNPSAVFNVVSATTGQTIPVTVTVELP